MTRKKRLAARKEVKRACMMAIRHGDVTYFSGFRFVRTRLLGSPSIR